MKKNKSIICIILCILAFIFAFTLYLLITDNGVGVNSDSTTYFALAKNVLAGNGYSLGKGAFSHFPPVYSFLLAFSGSFTSNVVDSARWLHAFLYASNAVLFGISIYMSTRRNLIAMIIGFLFFFSSRIILTIHSYAWSEAPFIFFSLLSYLLLSGYISSHRWGYLVLSSILLGLAITTRYVGFALIPPVMLVLLFLDQSPWKTKIKSIILNLVLSLTPIGIWFIRNLIYTHSVVNRSFIYHPKGIRRLTLEIVQVFHDFFFPEANSTLFMVFELSVFLILIIFAIVILYKKRSIPSEADHLSISYISLGFFFSISFIIVVTFSMFFFDAATAFNERILSPVLILLTISSISLICNYSYIEKKQVIWISFVVCVLFSVRINFFPVVDMARDMHRNGIGYNAVIWNESQTLSTLKTINPEIKIYSNGYDIISYKTGFNASTLPTYYSSTNLTQNGNFNHQIKAMCQEISDGKALLVYLDTVSWRDYLPTESRILEKYELPILYSLDDGTIYGISK